MLEKYLENYHKLLACTPISFADKSLRKKLPAKRGIYRISENNSNLTDTLYLGRAEDIQERVYRGHLMGNTSASILKKKLVRIKFKKDVNQAKKYLKEKCCVQFVNINDQKEVKFIEHFLISIFRPEYND